MHRQASAAQSPLAQAHGTSTKAAARAVGKRVRTAARTALQKRSGSLSRRSSESQATGKESWLAQAANSVVLPKPAPADSNTKGSAVLWFKCSIRGRRGSTCARTGGVGDFLTRRGGSLLPL